jgi:hypothetical protein
MWYVADVEEEREPNDLETSALKEDGMLYIVKVGSRTSFDIVPRYFYFINYSKFSIRVPAVRHCELVNE